MPIARKKGLTVWPILYDQLGGPKGSRTPVFGVRGRRPRPLDDGAIRVNLFKVSLSLCQVVLTQPFIRE